MYGVIPAMCTMIPAALHPPATDSVLNNARAQAYDVWFYTYNSFDTWQRKYADGGERQEMWITCLRAMSQLCEWMLLPSLLLWEMQWGQLQMNMIALCLPGARVQGNQYLFVILFGIVRVNL